MHFHVRGRKRRLANSTPMPVVYKPRAYALLYPEVFRQDREWSRAELRCAGVAEADVAPLWRMLVQSRRIMRAVRELLAKNAE